jgi:hypothetical protein
VQVKNVTGTPALEIEVNMEPRRATKTGTHRCRLILNTEVAIFDNEGIGLVAIIRNDNGEVICAASKFFGVSSPSDIGEALLHWEVPVSAAACRLLRPQGGTSRTCNLSSM